MDDAGFRTVKPQGKRKYRDEVDPNLIISDKRSRTESARLSESRKQANTEQQSRKTKQKSADTTELTIMQTSNRFAILDNADGFSAAGAENLDFGNPGGGDFIPTVDSEENESDESSDSSEESEEIGELLPRKTIPDRSKGKTGTKARKARDKKIRKTAKTSSRAGRTTRSAKSAPEQIHRTTVEDDDDDDVVITSPPLQNEKPKQAVKSKWKPPVYLFFEEVETDEKGDKGEEGDKHYRCYHGNRRVLTVSKKMKASQTGLIGHLRAHFKSLYGLYEVLKNRGHANPPTAEEIEIARGEQPLSIERLKQLRDATKGFETLTAAFAHQEQKNQEPWTQKMFERKIAEWLVADDQPFTAVESGKYQSMMHYVHRLTGLTIPSAETVKRRVLEMKDDALAELKDMISNLRSKVSLSLDAWSSSNGYAFLAIVMHYVTNDWKLEEILIDFREIIGPHSGENLSDVVWKMLELYGLKDKLLAIVADNATNNDTLLEALEEKMSEENIPFKANEARMRCVPHTTHLSAMKLLEAIGAVKKLPGSSGAYQESVAALITKEFDNEEAAHEDEPEDADEALHVLNSIEKLRKIIRAVRSSPQRRKAWLNEVNLSLAETDSSLGRALKYKSVIDCFVAKNCELRIYELSDTDWKAIALVTQWLACFRQATTFMSTTKESTLSSTYGVFKSLQDRIRVFIKELPTGGVPSELRAGLMAAHRKLSDYFYTFDASPYYMWAALLDPRMSYAKLKDDARKENDDVLLDLIEMSRQSLEERFAEWYPLPSRPNTPPPPPPATDDDMASPSKAFDFMARYQTPTEADPIDELKEYFSMKRERSWKDGEPVRWWAARRAQFPHLSLFVRDILSIPGSAVAVERIFSGGRDTIALRCASLKADTIRTLMLVKQWLRAKRTK